MPGDELEYESIIRRLSNKLNTPLFPAHVTLFCGYCENKEELTRSFSKLFLHQNKLILEKSDVVIGNSFYKTLYIKLFSNTAIQKLFHLAKETDQNSSYELKPHLSLLYGKHHLDTLEKLKTFAEQNIYGESMTFNKISLYTDHSDESYEAISSWEEIKSVTLR